MRSIHTWLAFCPALALAAPAVADSEHDVHFLSEHVPESAMDAHYLALPWPAAHLEPGTWRQSVDLSTAATRTELIDVDGPMIAFAATRGVTRTSGYEVLGFYSGMDVSGDGGRADLDPFLRAVPLDLPAPADFTHPRGTFRHFGVGAAYVRERSGRNAAHAPQMVAGVLLERTDLSDFELDYRLAAGANEGATGVLDHSTRATFVTPFAGWQQTRPLSGRWSWSPRALLAWPLPPSDLHARLTGPGFDLTAPSEAGSQPQIGDPFVVVGLALAHRPSGLEVDVGGTAFFALAENLSHAGVDHSFVVHVAWRPRRVDRPD